MNQSRTEPGQSMEEILASIRRIIAEGEREAQEAGGQSEGTETAAAARSEPATGSNAAEAGQTEVLVLTEMVQDDGSVVSLPPAPAGEEPQDVGPDESPPAAFPGEGTSSIAAAVAIETVRDGSTKGDTRLYLDGSEPQRVLAQPVLQKHVTHVRYTGDAQQLSRIVEVLPALAVVETTATGQHLQALERVLSKFPRAALSYIER